MILDAIRFARLTEIPLPVESSRAAWFGVPGEQTPARRATPAVPTRALLPALTGAHALAAPVAVGWVRTCTGASIEILVGGGLLADDARAGNAGRVRIPYPPGAVGTTVSRESALATLRRLPCWLHCAGRLEPLAALPSDAAEHPGLLLEDIAAQLSPKPFGWLVIGEPVAADEVLALADDLAYEQAPLPEKADASLREELAWEQARGRHRELVRAATLGAWRVHVLAGGITAALARRAADLLCASSDLQQLPYQLTATPDRGSLDDALAPTLVGRSAPAGFPFIASGELLAAVARPPVREVPGVRLASPSSFDVTPEVAGEIPLGTVLDRDGQFAGDLAVSLATLNRHALVTGATGAGKSQTVRHLLEGLHGHGVPWLVIEPAKAEYAGMAGRLPAGPDLVVIRPGALEAAPVTLNPLEPATGFPLQTHLDLVRALFLAAFAPHEPFPQVLSRALVRCYQDQGWDLATGDPRSPTDTTPRYPDLADLQHAAAMVVTDVGYGKELTADIRGFVDVRLGSLRLGGTGRFFEGGHPLDFSELLRRDAVVELEEIGDDRDKAFVIGAILIRLAEHLRVSGAPVDSPRALRHVTVIEEAHRLLRATTTDSAGHHAVELFASLLAEIRAYGEGIIVAEQIPTKLSSDVVKNTALKVLHRLPAQDDRDVVGAAMNLAPDQSRYVVSLSPGRAAVFTDGMDRPLLVQVPLGEQRECRGPDTRAPVTVLAGRRGPACGASCQQSPCTTRQIAGARRLAADPRLRLWMELLTLAHVIGEPRPVPLPGMLSDLTNRAEPRTVECALAHLAEQATDRRHRPLAERYPPAALAAHLADQATGVLCHDVTPCQPSTEPQWRAGRYRYAAVIQQLSTWQGDRSRPHPETARWRQRGIELPETGVEGQLAAVRQHHSLRADPRTLLHGDRAPSALAAAVEELSPSGPFHERLRQATAFLASATDWPVHWLTTSMVPDGETEG